MSSDHYDVHLPLGVHLTQDAHGQATADSRCIRCDRVDGFPCLVGAKADAEWAVLRPALAAHPNLSLMTRTTVERLVTDAAGRSVAGVAATLPDGSPHTFTADVVVLSAGVILSAALLLKSASDRYPEGLANSSGMVGRNYMRHNNLALIAFSRTPNPTVFQKTLALNDFYGPLALQPGNNTESLTRLRRTFQETLAKLGMADTTFMRSLYLHKAFDAAATAHQAGTARFGTDQAGSVLDVHCKAHDLDNLYVVDSSFMPSIGAVNPTLTIIANALRVGDHIAERTGTAGPA